ncbi:MAG TPA: TetR/AcrR family transcriptional regulator [Spirochaetota bacterium]|nr:TetR/AcrR family transcriptional regulator [Spirochaetota bacterium]
MTSRQRILDAAIPVFARKGRYGAHMEDIAALAHINKAMIYYIFHSKDELYLEVLKFVFNEASFSISAITDENIRNRDSYADALAGFIKLQINFFSENSQYTKIMVDAMSSGAEEIPAAINYFKSNHGGVAPTTKLREIIEQGKSQGIIRDINTDHLIISIIGMVIIYFFSQSITESLDIEVKDEQKFLEERKESIIDLVLNSILIKDTKKSTRKRIKNKEEL